FSLSSKHFSSFIDVFWKKFAAVFSGEVYHTKAFDKCQQFFLFLFLIFQRNRAALFQPGKIPAAG
ncbi:hypothetical protein, partial [Lacrimispora amygdalina]|uniref:hypothetical protein n=1 Tax=Lacrimispora amygdalina TaxID=253257 RepID=UPI0031F728F0